MAPRNDPTECADTQTTKYNMVDGVEELIEHPFVRAVDEMMTAYNGEWPPRPDFENWPKCFEDYVNITDAMPEKLVSLNDPTLFRSWLSNELKNMINLDAVIMELEGRMSTDDGVSLAFFAPLAFLANAYRWGSVPTTDEEKMRNHLEFPPEIWTPFNMLNDYWGLVHRGNTFSLNVANCLYEEDDPEVPRDMRFCFNHDLAIVNTEKNFFLSFLHMEKTFKPALTIMARYMTLTEQARIERKDAEILLEERVDLLKKLKKVLNDVSKVFTRFMKEHMVATKYWSSYVQALPAWNINGIDGGASGGESLAFHCYDEFLGTLGNGVIYKGGMRKREGIPKQYINVLAGLHYHGMDYRFDSFLNLNQSEDPLLKAKDDLIKALYTWRLSHAKVAPRYLKTSKMTSGFSVDKVLIDGETLAERGEHELRERARETGSYMTNPPPSCRDPSSDIRKVGQPGLPTNKTISHNESYVKRSLSSVYSLFQWIGFLE